MTQKEKLRRIKALLPKNLNSIFADTELCRLVNSINVILEGKDDRDDKSKVQPKKPR